jgi:hypothetical protein
LRARRLRQNKKTEKRKCDERSRHKSIKHFYGPSDIFLHYHRRHLTAMLGKAGLTDGRNIAIEFDREARNYPWFWNVRLEGTADVWA